MSDPRTPQTGGTASPRAVSAPAPGPARRPPAGPGLNAADDSLSAAAGGDANPPSHATGTPVLPGAGVPAQTSPSAQANPSPRDAEPDTSADGDSGRAPGSRRRGTGSPADGTGETHTGPVSPAAAPGLRGKEWRDAVKTAKSRQAAAQRNQRGRYTRNDTTSYRPGMGRMNPGGSA